MKHEKTGKHVKYVALVIIQKGNLLNLGVLDVRVNAHGNNTEFICTVSLLESGLSV